MAGKSNNIELIKELKKSLSMFDWDEMERLLDNASIDA